MIPWIIDRIQVEGLKHPKNGYGGPSIITTNYSCGPGHGGGTISEIADGSGTVFSGGDIDFKMGVGNGIVYGCGSGSGSGAGAEEVSKLAYLQEDTGETFSWWDSPLCV